ncbi:abc30e38-5736-4010-85ef-a26d7f7cfb8f [Thermothielavioides terrestris]|uniref:Abc30e38-5736-4010-85ef-a26d7f7cfb8f n=1 Tax=Thermothielavioides terrestris TaxID=2587410 RepID=A0A446B519_9PEZI|nr:abc30e38-5736-4010-85ef-a26d7f7cfb8f [Thermothielavioides terrestris]
MASNRLLGAACSAAGEAVERATLAVSKFVQEVRECRCECDAIATELHSLHSVLDLLESDATLVPASFAAHTAGVLDTCLALINELEGCVLVLNRPGVPRADKKSRWLASRDHIDKLRRTLGEYKLVLGLAVDLVGIIKTHTSDRNQQDTSIYSLDPTADGMNQQSELAAVADRVIDATHRLQPDLHQNAALLRLGRYLLVLQAQTASAREGMGFGLRAHRRDASSSAGGAPDSAIDMSYEDADAVSHYAGEQTTTASPTDVSSEPYEEELDDFSKRSQIRGSLQRVCVVAEAASSVTFSTPFGSGHAPTCRPQLANAVRSLAMRRPAPAPNIAEDQLEPDSNAVFGVSLTRSMQVAKGIASTAHSSGRRSERVTREYPLCVLRCVCHILDCGLDAPHIFGLDGDQVRVAQLIEVFSSAETGYGKELDWSHFTVYDAADVILLFLSELPKPLIPEPVGKRWIALSRQATAGLARLDQGLDFWEEALTGMHGPGRALFKLLLNLWGDIADAADANEMTAERLAGRLIRPLMHALAAHDHLDFMLGLAFLIRKRSEYNLAARGVMRKSNAAFYMTAREKVEQFFTGRLSSEVPGKTLARLISAEPQTKEELWVLNMAMHYGQGAVAAVIRGVASFYGLRGPFTDFIFIGVRLIID